jgi:tetratricopeptide (TPR) repeat protein
VADENVTIRISLEHAAVRAAIEASEWDTARWLALRLATSDKTDHEARHLLGLVELLGGDPHQAVAHIDDAIRIRNDIAQYHGNLAEALRRSERPEEGVTAARVALAIEPDYFEATVNLGACLFATGDHDGALEAFEEALRHRPDDPSLIAARADAMRELGFVRGALRLYERALEIDPDNAHAHANLGPLLTGVGRSDDALEHCKRAVELDPDSATPYLNLGRCLVDLDELEEAMDAYADAYDRDPSNAVLCCGIAQVWQEVGDLQQAELWYGRALDAEPDRSETRCGLASVWAEQDRFDEAIATYHSILETDPENFAAHLGLGRTLWEDGEAEHAVEQLRKAAELRPEVANVQATVGSVLASAGDVAGATACHEQALKINPSCIPALNGLSTTLRGKTSKGVVREMQQLLRNPRLRDGPRSALHNGLSYYFDGVERYDEAAKHVEKANELYWNTKIKRGWTYEPDEHIAEVDGIIARYTPEFFERMRPLGMDTDLPAFIVGLPRSGTTLTEQILASHPRVVGAGERPFAGRAFAHLPVFMGRPGERAIDVLPDGDEAVIRRAGAWHVERLLELIDDASLRVEDIDRVVDKLPDNYLLCGWIRTCFPNAKIISVRRDVRDVAVSCWQTQFAKIRWAFNHEHLINRVQQYKRVMAHWRSVLPGPYLEFDYEDLVADQERVSRELVAFLGLEWDPACLAFHKTERVVRTASVTQVREPIYKRSVERWRAYEGPLADVFAAIAP